MNEVNNEYFWLVQEWWNENSTYRWLQYISNDYITLEKFYGIIEKWLSDIVNTNNTRLDIRSFILNDFDISYMKNKYKNSDIAIKKVDWKLYIIFWINIGDRKLSEEKMDELRKNIRTKIINIASKTRDWWWFEQYSIDILKEAKDKWFSFERKYFWVDEVFTLWWDNFGWAKEDISSFMKQNEWKDRVFWLRDEEWVLISLLMIANDFETSEWSVLKEYQGHWVIEPLIIASNWLLVAKWEWENIYAHMRCNRSLSPWLKWWLRINAENWTENILTNFVEVEGVMEQFLEWILDTSLFTKKLLKEIRDFTK